MTNGDTAAEHYERALRHLITAKDAGAASKDELEAVQLQYAQVEALLAIARITASGYRVVAR